MAGVGLAEPDERTRVIDAVAEVLGDGEHLARKQLTERLEARGVDTTKRIGFIKMAAELERVAISGAPQGKQQTIAAFDDRVPASAPLDHDEAIARLAGRYLQGHGPATPHDLAWWGGITVGDARRGYEACGAQSWERDGLTYWDVEGLDTPSASAPGYSTSGGGAAGSSTSGGGAAGSSTSGGGAAGSSTSGGGAAGSSTSGGGAAGSSTNGGSGGRVADEPLGEACVSRPRPTSGTLVHLLPPYDEYLIAYKNRQAVDASADYQREPTERTFWAGLAVADGRVVGGWKWKRPTRTSEPVRISLSLLTRTTSARARFAPETERFARYLGVPVDLTLEDY